MRTVLSALLLQEGGGVLLQSLLTHNWMINFIWLWVVTWDFFPVTVNGLHWQWLTSEASDTVGLGRGFSFLVFSRRIHLEFSGGTQKRGSLLLKYGS